mmetsp:Transcript_44693/g.72835  ORF Transcript_44693/g.72835 Transcript_44693/m.72835 type:complete len:100 (+) Transcript_44693:101-400(+)
MARPRPAVGVPRRLFSGPQGSAPPPVKSRLLSGQGPLRLKPPRSAAHSCSPVDTVAHPCLTPGPEPGPGHEGGGIGQHAKCRGYGHGDGDGFHWHPPGH